MARKFKISLFCGIIIVLFAQQSLAQFFKSYDFAPFTTRTDIGYSLEKFSNAFGSGWTIAGVSNSMPDAGGYDWLFMKLNSAGSVTCKTLLGFTLDDSAFSHVQLNNGRVVVAGFYRAPGGKEKASWSMIDTNCSHLISKQVFDTTDHQYRGVTKNTADMFTLTGWIDNFIPGTGYKNQIIASQYTPAGALMWSYKYIPPFPWVDEKAYSICYQPTDGSYAITGITNRFTGPAGPYQVFIMKITGAGIPVWFKGFSPVPGAPSNARKIIAMPDGGFTICGFSNAFDAAFNDYYVVRTSSTGVFMWQNLFGVPGYKEQAYSIVYQASDASLVFTGLWQAPTATEEVAIAKISAATGLPLWFKKFPNAAGDDRGYDIELGIPSGFGVTGQYFHPTSMTLDVHLIKSDASGFVTPGCNDSLPVQVRPAQYKDSCQRQIYQLSDITIQPQVHSPSHVEKTVCGTTTGINGNNYSLPEEYSLEQNYPNPFNPTTKISYSIKTAGNVKLSIYNSAGKLVKELVNRNQEQGNYEVTLDGISMSSGVYFYTLEADGFSATKKMVLIK